MKKILTLLFASALLTSCYVAQEVAEPPHYSYEIVGNVCYVKGTPSIQFLDRLWWYDGVYYIWYRDAMIPCRFRSRYYFEKKPPRNHRGYERKWYDRKPMSSHHPMPNRIMNNPRNRKK